MHSIAAPSSRFLPSYSCETSGAEALTEARRATRVLSPGRRRVQRCEAVSLARGGAHARAPLLVRLRSPRAGREPSAWETLCLKHG